jgi:hypothetical protein
MNIISQVFLGGVNNSATRPFSSVKIFLEYKKSFDIILQAGQKYVK